MPRIKDVWNNHYLSNDGTLKATSSNLRPRRMTPNMEEIILDAVEVNGMST